MIGNYSARMTGSKRTLLALLASSLVFSAGCSDMSSTAPAVNSLATAATLTGKVHGGNQPVVGATVTLWFAGQGFPVPPATTTAIKAATATTDSTGSFSFTKDTAGGHDGTTPNWSCPTNTGSPLVYVLSQGGNTQNNGGPVNTAASFIALYGDCSSISGSNFVYMSEVTTVATMAVVSQFFNPADSTLKADATGQQRLIMLNLPNTVALLADSATGLANSSKTISAAGGGSIAGGVSLTATPETAKINTLANIISACVNGATSADPACTTLFSSAAPPIPNTTNLNGGIFPTATDTLQALYYICTNPSNSNATNLSALFGLQPAVGAPYAPMLSAAPTDWTIGVNYASTGSSCTTGSFISSPTDINIDGQDNVWFGNAQAGGNLSAISATGAPLFCVNFDPGASATGGTLDANTPSSGVYAPNVWFAGPATMYRYNPNSKTTFAFPVGVTPLAITADGAGNVYFTAVSGVTGSLYQIPGASSAVAPVAAVEISNTVGPNPMRLMADNQSATPKTAVGNIWVSSGSNFISQVSPTAASGSGILNGFLTTPYAAPVGSSYGLTLDAAGDVFASAIDTNAIFLLLRGGSTWSPAGGNWPFTSATAGISGPKGIAVDGRANTWIPNSGASSLSEISFFGPNALSPATGFQKDPTFLNANTALAVDQAGNVWVAGTGNNFITEIVGGAVPLYAPYAVGIAVGRFQAIP
jgi:hypothetical protein